MLKTPLSAVNGLLENTGRYKAFFYQPHCQQSFQQVFNRNKGVHVNKSDFHD